MLYNTNFIAWVGGGSEPKFENNIVIIWDASKSKILGQLKFGNKVLNVKLTMEKYLLYTY